MSIQKGKAGHLSKLIKKGRILNGFPWPDTIRNYDITIRQDGIWTHEGAPIQRPALTRLFSSILQCDNTGTHWLVTPTERGIITVEDTPFLAVELDIKGTGMHQILQFRTNLDHWIEAGPDHPLTVSHHPDTDEPKPVIEFRDKLMARITRSVFYELAEIAEEESHKPDNKSKILTSSTHKPAQKADPVLGVYSHGLFFPLNEKSHTKFST